MAEIVAVRAEGGAGMVAAPPPGAVVPPVPVAVVSVAAPARRREVAFDIRRRVFRMHEAVPSLALDQLRRAAREVEEMSVQEPGSALSVVAPDQRRRVV